VTGVGAAFLQFASDVAYPDFLHGMPQAKIRHADTDSVDNAVGLR
jgi:hypothetical protein